MFVPEEEHECGCIVEFVHLFEVGNLIEIADVDYCEVLDAVCDACGEWWLANAYR